MKKTPTLLLIMLLVSGEVWSEESIVPNRYHSGDVVTADSLNESFDALAQYQRHITTADVLGDWDCLAVGPASTGLYYPYKGTDFSLSPTRLTLSKSVKLFFRSSNGKTTLSSNSISPFSQFSPPGVRNPTFNEPFEIVADGLYFYNRFISVSSEAVTSYDEIKEIVRYNITRTARDELMFVPRDYGTQATLTCKASQSAPTNPTGLTITTNGGTVQATWTDNSANEDAFIVLRKKEGELNFSQVTTVSASTSLCSESLPVGTYYYQVKARNTYGDSAGSNVVKAAVKN